jgi:Txe/YoeB family toxin of Txe-Axe toxin-antitoxin module
MRLLWTREAWRIKHWQRTDPKLVVAINALIDDLRMNDPFKGLGKPEPLKHSLKGGRVASPESIGLSIAAWQAKAQRSSSK